MHLSYICTESCPGVGGRGLAVPRGLLGGGLPMCRQSHHPHCAAKETNSESVTFFLNPGPTS